MDMDSAEDLHNMDLLQDTHNMNSVEDIDNMVVMMEDLGIDDESATSEKEHLSKEDAKMLLIKRCIDSLVHACQCKDDQCSVACVAMKRVIRHAESCGRKRSGICAICKPFVSLCCFHAKVCSDASCPVIFCPTIKHKLKQIALRERLEQALQTRRQLAVMDSAGESGGAKEA